MPKKYVSPDGLPIVGTLETVKGCANLTTINDDGTPNYDGSTKVYWDEQVTVQRDGKRVFLDEDGNEWTFDQLKVEEEQSEDEVA